MEKYIVRCDRSGAFYGEVEKREGREVPVVLGRSGSLLQMAAEGVSKPRECKFTVAVDELTVLDAIEILPCTERAVRSIEGVEEWRA